MDTATSLDLLCYDGVEGKLNIFFSAINAISYLSLSIFFTNLFGLFFTYGGIYRGMVLYSTILFCSTFASIVYSIIIFRFRKRIGKNSKENFRRLWALGSMANMTEEIEKNFACCGWNNVFDHCSGAEMSAIMYQEAVKIKVK